MDSYPYQPLDSELAQIRLLHLLPKTADPSTATERSDQVWISAQGDSSADEALGKSARSLETIGRILPVESETPCVTRGKLKTVSLVDEPQYTALSYVWGNAIDKVPFILDDHEVLITRNLAFALQALQLNDQPFVLWIDAISINQSNPIEKSEQVLYMKDIYASASLVIVWWGAATTGTDLAVDVFNAYEQKSNVPKDKLLTARHKYRTRDEQRQELLKQSPPFKSLIEGNGLENLQLNLSFLLVKDWWYRVWVIQEFCVGKEVWFSCGSKKLRLDVFENVLMWLSLYHQFSIAHVTLTLDQRLSSPNYIVRARKGPGAIQMEHAIHMLRQRQQHQYRSEEKKHGSLLDLLITFYVNVRQQTRIRSTDPRDKLYGLLSIASDVEQLDIVPDYKKSVEEVYTEVAAKILKIGRLDLLQFIRPRNPEMPSWVPDWRLEERQIAPNDCRDIDNPFLPFDTLEPVIPRQCTENANVLECTACIVDTVCSFSDFETDETTSAIKALAEMPSNKADNTEFIALERMYIHLEQIKQLCQRSAMTNPGLYGPHDTWFDEALWRIPIADQELIDAHTLEYQRATSESEQRYRSLIKTIQAWTSIGRRLADPDPRPLPAFLEEKVRPVISSEASSYSLYKQAMKRTLFRKPFVTEKGYVGLGQEDMQHGDLVCIFYGSPVPLLLRPTSDGQHILIGDAYVYGIMDGEFMQTKPENDVFQIV